MARTKPPGRFHRRGHIDAHRAAQKQALLPQQLIDRLERGLVVDAHGIIDGSTLQVGGNAAVANPLGDRTSLTDQLTPASPGVQGAAVGVGQHAAHGGFLLLQIQGNPGIGAAGASGRHPGIHRPSGLLPDLRTGGVEMGAAVGQVVELVGPHGPRRFGGDTARKPHVVVGVAVRHRRHRAHLGAEAAQQADLLGRLGVGDHDQGPVAAGVAEVGEANTGVASGAFHHRASRLQQPLLLRLQQDAQGRPVLDRPPRIHELGLAEDLAARLLAQGIEPDQGRVANGAHEP